ncbi:MAG: 2-polyprenylphenol 6-hydroxylase [Mariprofundaceae bacterium]|nr:2-polyprenylphenol 6-hydroxylase [Mariprofundaceae bacterium]
MKLSGNIQRNLRLLRIGYILTSHGMAALAMRMRLLRPYAWLIQLFRDDTLPHDLGGQIREALEKLGPTFIKFGQMLSTRVDLLPLEVALELKKLQDHVPPAPFEHVKEVIERTCKKPLTGEGGLYQSFDETPIAAASIAQVHFATLAGGQQVAVKVRRPHIHKTIEADLAILRLLAGMFERYFPEYQRLKAQCVVEEFATSIRGELNLRAEAAHASRFEENFKALDGVRVPHVIWDYTHVEVLTTERIKGFPIDERAAILSAGLDPLKICERATILFFHMVFEDGYFHADMHPGNIFVAKNGDIVLLDFGIVGRLDIRPRRYLADMLLAFLREDYHQAAVVHVEAAYVPRDTNISAFEDALREVAVPIFNRPLADISIAELLLCMFAVTERFQMETQPELLLLQKTMVVIEGVARELADDVNIWELAKPLVSNWMMKHMGPKAHIEHMAEDVKTQLYDWMTLPTRIDTMIEHVKQSKLMEPPKSSFIPTIMGVLLSAAGIAMLLGQTLHIPHWHMILGSSLLIFGMIMIVQRKS